jgi:DNA-binding beta-propeller fold protein YncE
MSGSRRFVQTGIKTKTWFVAKRGFAINANFITGLSFSTGFTGPSGIAVLGNRLFVTNFGGGTVGEYDATTGAAINANFIAGLGDLIGIAVKSAK